MTGPNITGIICFLLVMASGDSVFGGACFPIKDQLPSDQCCNSDIARGLNGIEGLVHGICGWFTGGKGCQPEKRQKAIDDCQKAYWETNYQYGRRYSSLKQERKKISDQTGTLIQEELEVADLASLAMTRFSNIDTVLHIIRICTNLEKQDLKTHQRCGGELLAAGNLLREEKRGLATSLLLLKEQDDSTQTTYNQFFESLQSLENYISRELDRLADLEYNAFINKAIQKRNATKDAAITDERLSCKRYADIAIAKAHTIRTRFLMAHLRNDVWGLWDNHQKLEALRTLSRLNLKDCDNDMLLTEITALIDAGTEKLAIKPLDARIRKACKQLDLDESCATQPKSDQFLYGLHLFLNAPP